MFDAEFLFLFSVHPSSMHFLLKHISRHLQHTIPVNPTHVLDEPLSPQARCLGSTSSRSQGFTGGLSKPWRRPDSLAILGYFLHKSKTLSA